MFVSAYGPGSERSEEEREAFWSELAGCVEERKTGSLSGNCARRPECSSRE